MKNIITIILCVVLGFAFTSCGSKDSKDAQPAAGTHVHEDGTVHANDAHDQDAATNQESFNVDDDAEHTHDGDGGEHTHEHSDSDGHEHDSDDDHEHEHGDSEGHDHDHGDHN